MKSPWNNEAAKRFAEIEKNSSKHNLWLILFFNSHNLKLSYLGSKVKIAPKTMTVHLWEINSKAANRRKLKNYPAQSQKVLEKSVKKKLKCHVANAPRIGFQAKNSSILSKNSNASDPKASNIK